MSAKSFRTARSCSRSRSAPRCAGSLIRGDGSPPHLVYETLNKTAGTGHPEVLASIWFGRVAPAGTSQPIVDKINKSR